MFSVFQLFLQQVQFLNVFADRGQRESSSFMCLYKNTCMHDEGSCIILNPFNPVYKVKFLTRLLFWKVL